ncbi:MAG TPA: peroxiredoxin [Actinomycetota bacterium]|nr:peroxiredoxin [Actinomycetota bacterium]
MDTTAHDPTILPPNLPVPVDDGAADHLPGMRVPSLALRSTRGDVVDPADLAAGRAVLYVFPATGRPGVAPPAGWDAIPGARGCTPQSCAFRDAHSEFAARGYRVAGLSVQAPEVQAEAVRRLHLPFELLADPDLEMARRMRLPTFDVEGKTYLKRLTMVLEDGAVTHVFYPVFPPDANAGEVLAWLAARAS